MRQPLTDFDNTAQSSFTENYLSYPPIHTLVHCQVGWIVHTRLSQKYDSTRRQRNGILLSSFMLMVKLFVELTCQTTIIHNVANLLLICIR